VGDFLILRALRESGGHAVAVSDADMERGVRDLGAATGVFACPEGGATLAAARALAAAGRLGPDAEVVLFNTGSGLNYVAA
jgi:threonine synthase